MKAKQKLRFKVRPYWFIHHCVLLEWNTEPISGRITYIKHAKSRFERPNRLKALKPVKRPDLLPVELRRLGKQLEQKLISYGGYPNTWPGTCIVNNLVIRMRRKSLQPKTYRKLVARHKKEFPRCPCNYYFGLRTGNHTRDAISRRDERCPQLRF